MRWITLTTIVLQTLVTSGQADFVSARFVSGDAPVVPVLAVSGGEVFVEALVTAEGRVGSVRVLRTTPPFTDALIEAVRGWQFAPAAVVERVQAQNAGHMTRVSTPVAGPVFVAGMFAPPTLIGPTLGQPPHAVLSPSDEAPTPTTTMAAAYPPRAIGDGTVLVAVTIDGSGALTDAYVVGESSAFDQAAMTAARSWSFRPARRGGNAVTAHAYLVFAFRQPVTGR